jgi:hypothetical protein
MYVPQETLHSLPQPFKRNCDSKPYPFHRRRCVRMKRRFREAWLRCLCSNSRSVKPRIVSPYVRRRSDDRMRRVHLISEEAVRVPAWAIRRTIVTAMLICRCGLSPVGRKWRPVVSRPRRDLCIPPPCSMVSCIFSV